MPGFRVSKAARDDIRGIGLYTQQIWGVAQRRRYLTGLNERFGDLEHFPITPAHSLSL
jgi:toxin ParE1/3/4